MVKKCFLEAEVPCTFGILLVLWVIEVERVRTVLITVASMDGEISIEEIIG